MKPPTPVSIDASRVFGLSSFLRLVAVALDTPYFGWDLTSFADCLYGGFAPTAPPYRFEVSSRSMLVSRLGYSATKDYCAQKLIRVYREISLAEPRIDSFEMENKEYFEAWFSRAVSEEGETLFDELVELLDRSDRVAEIVFLRP